MRDTDVASWAAHEYMARAIVTAMGPHWTLIDASHEPAQWHDWRARRSDSLTLAFSWADKYSSFKDQNRLQIRGVYPHDQAGDVKVPSRTHEGKQPTTEISVEASKPAATIAKDINRRLIPGFELVWRRAWEMANHADFYAQQVQDGMNQIIAAIPGAHRSPNSKGSVYFDSAQHAYAVSVQGDDVRFESFTCPLEVAILVLQATRKDPTCSACGIAITLVQAQLSTLRADDAEPTCKDCLGLAATAAAVAEGHDYAYASDVARMQTEQAERRTAAGYAGDDGTHPADHAADRGQL